MSVWSTVVCLCMSIYIFCIQCIDCRSLQSWVPFQTSISDFTACLLKLDISPVIPIPFSSCREKNGWMNREAIKVGLFSSNRVLPLTWHTHCSIFVEIANMMISCRKQDADYSQVSVKNLVLTLQLALKKCAFHPGKLFGDFVWPGDFSAGFINPLVKSLAKMQTCPLATWQASLDGLPNDCSSNQKRGGGATYANWISSLSSWNC